MLVVSRRVNLAQPISFVDLGVQVGPAQAPICQILRPKLYPQATASRIWALGSGLDVDQTGFY